MVKEVFLEIDQDSHFVIQVEEVLGLILLSTFVVLVLEVVGDSQITYLNLNAPY